MRNKLRFAACIAVCLGVAYCTGYSTQEILDATFVAKDKTPVNLLSPPDKTVSTKNPNFVWTSRNGASSYLLEISSKADFSQIVLSKTIASGSSPSYTLLNTDLNSLSALDAASYYWRVTADYAGDRITSTSALFHVLADNIVYVSAGASASNQIGNKSFPFTSIQAAIENANTRRSGVANVAMDVYVAAAASPYAEEISLRPGISIRGGYLATDWSRNIAANVTTIQAPIDMAIKAGPTITGAYTSTTWVEGFTVQGAANTISYGIFLSNSSPTLSNNIITGGTVTANGSSYGIYCNSSAPTISNNTMTGGLATGGGATSYGLYNNSSSPVISGNTISGGSGNVSRGISNTASSPTITNNTINGGQIPGGSGASYGIENLSSSSPVISNNIINGGTSLAGNSAGIYNTLSSPTISGNTITGGESATSYGILNMSNSPITIVGNVIRTSSVGTGSLTYGISNSSAVSTSTVISRNTIWAGSAGNDSYGISNTASSSPTISNNTIISGAAVAAGVRSFGIFASSSSPAILNNTVIVGPSGTSSFGIYMDSTVTSTLRNNVIVLTGKTSNRYAIYENALAVNPTSVQNNVLYDIGTGGTFYTYRDVDGTGQCYSGGASSSGNCINIADLEADLNAEAAGIAGGNINQNPMFVNFPVKLDSTREGADAGTTYNGTANTLEVTDCTDYVTNEYLEYDRDGTARQITACSTATGSGIVTFTPALSTASVVSREVRLWGANSTNLVIDLQLRTTSPCDVREGGLNLSGLFSVDRDNVTRTPALSCGPVNTGATGWSIGAYERD
ncbi:MAG: hypothetical protein U1F40_07295 [Turneriella sp.]